MSRKRPVRRRKCLSLGRSGRWRFAPNASVMNSLPDITWTVD